MRISSIYKLGKYRKRKKYKAPKAAPFMPEHSGVFVPKETTNRLKEFIKDHLSVTPRSEVWFNSLYKSHIDLNDHFNEPLGEYIPDVANYRYNYVIEIDGSIHDLEEVKKKDLKKNNYYACQGYRVIRVKAYDIESFNKCLTILNIIRKKIIKRNAPSFDTQEEINEYMNADISCSPTKVAIHDSKDPGIG